MSQRRHKQTRRASRPTSRPALPQRWFTSSRALAFLGLAAGLLLALLSTGGSPCTAQEMGPAAPATEPRKPGQPNRLIHEDSPYLQSAARQPVDWYPFGPEAFARAQELDRPILLDIGAVWCHWCHVMDRESYENAEIAEIINDMFVAIKVDRDARPDIDARYQRAVQAITGQGGWPLTAFLTPDGKVFFGGTYFPAQTRGNRPGLSQLLPGVSRAYRDNKDRVLVAADEIAQRLQAFEQASAQPGEVNPALLEKLVDAVRQDFDPEHGGQPGAPKFPHGAVVQLALERYAATKDPSLLEVAEKTLDAMARGGLRDPIHGGFYRYATDSFWHIPHFEKMAYVQAELLAAYSQAHSLTGKPLYRDAAEGIIVYLTDTLSDQARGGFYASQDADISLDDDGTYYTWTLAEVQQRLTEQEARAFVLRYGVVAAPDRHPPETPDRNVPYLAKSIEQVAAELGRPLEEVHSLLASARRKLRAARRWQQAPFVDTTKFIDWNAVLLSAYRHAYEALKSEGIKQFALRTTDFLLQTAYTPGKGMHHAIVEGKPRTTGLLDDQVYMARALLDMHAISGRRRYLDAARELMDYALEDFWDPEQGGFFDVAHGQDFVEILAQPRKELQDAPLPGPNAVATLTLDRLYALTGEERYREKAHATLAAFAGGAPRLGTFGASYGRALHHHLSLLKSPPEHRATEAR